MTTLPEEKDNYPSGDEEQDDDEQLADFQIPSGEQQLFDAIELLVLADLLPDLSAIDSTPFLPAIPNGEELPTFEFYFSRKETYDVIPGTAVDADTGDDEKKIEIDDASDPLPDYAQLYSINVLNIVELLDLNVVLPVAVVTTVVASVNSNNEAEAEEAVTGADAGVTAAVVEEEEEIVVAGGAVVEVEVEEEEVANSGQSQQPQLQFGGAGDENEEKVDETYHATNPKAAGAGAKDGKQSVRAIISAADAYHRSLETTTDEHKQVYDPADIDAAIQREKEKWSEFTEELIEWAENQENLDVFQMNAFYAGTHELSYYLLNYWKSVVCLFIQTAGLYILMDDEAGNAGLELCDPQSSRIDLKLLGFFLTTFLSLRLSGQIRTQARCGLYQWGSDQAPFINTGWVGYGLLVNYLSLIFSFFISLFILLVSGDSLDMILNFVALYFVIELDDEMVTWEDYNDVEEWLEGSGFEEFCRSRLALSEAERAMLAEEGVDEGDDVQVVTCVGRIGVTWKKAGERILRLLAFVPDNPRTVSVILAPFVFAAPVFVGVCFVPLQD